ncbi:MAG TPA: hypothetical protein VIR33_06335 [Thermopolyspora sp.]|jgi:hypothetical protein
MSFGTTRAELAAQLSTVAGVTGYAKRPTILKPGDAYPLLGGIGDRSGSAFQVTWRVIVILGKDEAAAIDKAEALLPELFEAIDPVAYVDGATPFAVPTQGGELFALEITTRSE